MDTRSPREMPQRPKRKLPLYIPKIMAELIWATTKDSTSVHFGFGHKCHKHGRLFNLEHIRTCSELSGCPDIAKYAQMIKGGNNIRLWDQEVLADAILQYTQLAVQLANLTARNLASLVQTPVKKKAPTGNKVGRPKATEVIAKTNHKLDDYYRKKPVQSDAAMMLQHSEEEKKQGEQPAEQKKHESNPQAQAVKGPQLGAPSTANKVDALLQRVQMALDLRESKRHEL